LDFFKTANDGKAYNLVHCWRVLNDFEKWKQTYTYYKKSLKNGNAPAAIDLEEEERNKGAPATLDLEEEERNKGTLPGRPRGHKASKGDLKRDVAALALSETFKGYMAEKEEALAKRKEKKHRDKEATCASFFDLTKRAIKVEETNAKAKAMEAEDKLLAEEREIMFVDMTNMTAEQRAWVEKCRVICRQREA
jgi:hypothetical protein